MGPNPPRSHYFHILPKIHKPPEACPKPHKITLESPIVPDCSSESYSSALLLFFLGPLSILHDSYCIDTADFLNKLQQQTMEPDSFLSIMDVDHLYTNIKNTRATSGPKQTKPLPL